MTARLLLVDDDPDILDALESLLDDVYTVSVAEDGDDALQQIRRGGFDCVVLDLMMPRLSGGAVLAAMAEEGINVPVILASASTEIGQMAARYGATDAITKPYDIELLEEKIEKLVAPSKQHSAKQREAPIAPPLRATGDPCQSSASKFNK
jgi:DNA-binding NtrC family response regulator